MLTRLYVGDTISQQIPVLTFTVFPPQGSLSPNSFLTGLKGYSIGGNCVWYCKPGQMPMVLEVIGPIAGVLLKGDDIKSPSG